MTHRFRTTFVFLFTLLTFTLIVGTASWAATPTTVSGIVFHDLNRNKKLDPGEPGIAGAHVWVTNHKIDRVLWDGLTGPDGRFHASFTTRGPVDLIMEVSRWKKSWRWRTSDDKIYLPGKSQVAPGSRIRNINFPLVWVPDDQLGSRGRKQLAQERHQQEIRKLEKKAPAGTWKKPRPALTRKSCWWYLQLRGDRSVDLQGDSVTLNTMLMEMGAPAMLNFSSKQRGKAPGFFMMLKNLKPAQLAAASSGSIRTPAWLTLTMGGSANNMPEVFHGGKTRSGTGKQRDPPIYLRLRATGDRMLQGEMEGVVWRMDRSNRAKPTQKLSRLRLEFRAAMVNAMDMNAPTICR